ncbi:serine--tRNA ligase [Roseomonas indoligenes]|uniref:Serine--tRNA ligase n=1 Tax=Roseomonas indoligenes TaxID=2820811 RepID=A0A940S790_9PROT|nr:serine--tRNA ligase [Pararoseomonas indoligenes]MBP0492837.1 serine--tRNA ligase [Pararoseomonas indoligenes]
MHDIRAVRADPAAFDAALARRGLAAVSAELLDLDSARRAAQTTAQEAQARRNALAREIGQGKKAGADTAALEAEATELRARMEGLDAEAKAAEAAQTRILEALPNILDADVPEGRDESSNVVLHQHGNVPNLPFAPKQHFELGEALGGMDFATAVKLAGSRFTVLRGPLARLERAIGQWMLNLHVDEHGYTETVVPLLVNDATMYGTGQLPKFADDLFRTTDDRWLIPTAEVPLTNTVRDEIMGEAALPLRMAALSPCFRSEAGSAGRDTRGMIRQHQFSKVEMVSITAPDASAEEHERMTRCAERVLTELGLVWRRILLCAGDTGFGATKTYDLEVWLPGQGAWREISSCSNCRDFQARRMNARMKPKEGKGNLFLHTLNGSGVAVGRALIAVMETHQQADGSIAVPEVLRPYMGGAEVIPAG